MGYQSFLIEYSVMERAGELRPLRELAEAVRILRERAEEWHIQPEHVAVLGFSAGGHLAASLGTLWQRQELGLPASARPDALVLCYPVSAAHGRTHEDSFTNLCGQDQALKDGLSLDRLVRRDMMPVFLWHTRTDDSVPVDGTMRLALALAEQDVPFALHVFAAGRHGLATADDLVYRRDNQPPVSDGVREWPELAVRFLWEQGFHIQDGE
jgi:acetyl esterase/lipase